MKNFYLIIMLVLLNACASGSNPYMNNANTIGMVGGAAGAAGGAILCKNCKGVAKVAAIGGGALLGFLFGKTAGEYFDRRDMKRNRDLITQVLNENQDNEMGQITYNKSFVNPDTGQTQNGTVTQSVTPRRTYQSQHLGADGKPLVPGGYNDSLYAQNDIGKGRYGYGARPLQGSTVCRDVTVDIEITGLSATPARNQFYSFCKTEQGWRQTQ
ncbi:hypothetical protein M1N16_08375 [Nitrospinaceae bacterium]|nr:hypothetical protein [Nitrospinaceae bacterium]